MAITLTLSQIIELSGGKPRRMKQLANEGVFLSLDEDRPSRAARRYTVPEAALACIIARLDRFDISAGTLAAIAASLREVYRVPADHGFATAAEAKMFWHREALLSLWEDEPGKAEAKKDAALACGFKEFPKGKPAGISTDEMHRIRHWFVLEEAREGKPTQLSLTVRDNECWTYWIDSQPREEDRVEIFIVLNLHHILSVLR